MSYKQSTIKHLWGASRNECAAPGCETKIIDINQDVVIGEIAHIRAQSPGGPRYDPSLSEDDIDDVSNLVVLCPTHHSIIDKKSDDYPPETLEKWKGNQSKETPSEIDTPDPLLQEWGNDYGGITINDGSFITSENQMGGQVAHNINNIGPQPRSIPPHIRKRIARQLQHYQPPSVMVTSIMGDGESLQLANQIIDVLERAGWDVEGPSQAVFTGAIENVEIQMSEEYESLRTFGELLLQAGIDAHGALVSDEDEIQIVTGTNI